MAEVFQPDPSNAVSKFRSAARRSGVMLAALAGIAMLAAPIDGAFGAQTTQVRNIDDPGRTPYQIFSARQGGHTIRIQFSGHACRPSSRHPAH
jgi:hypothetical protein